VHGRTEAGSLPVSPEGVPGVIYRQNGTRIFSLQKLEHDQTLFGRVIEQGCGGMHTRHHSCRQYSNRLYYHGDKSHDHTPTTFRREFLFPGHFIFLVSHIRHEILNNVQRGGVHPGFSRDRAFDRFL
jgi:hypothetical protein